MAGMADALAGGPGFQRKFPSAPARAGRLPCGFGRSCLHPSTVHTGKSA